MTIPRPLIALLPALWIGSALAADLESVTAQVSARERAFAKSMADRDLEAFKSFVAQDAIFFNGPQALRGKEMVVKAWSGLYEGETAPFSWDPDQVEVLDSGDLALSTGPVLNPAGKCVGRFNSIWRLIDDEWFVVFDKGSDECPPQEEAGTP